MNRASVDDTLHAPPRFLLWLIAVIFFLLVVGGLAGVTYFGGGQRLASLIPFAGIALFGVIVACIGGAVIFRHRLPRFFWLIVTFGAIIVVIAVVVGSIFAYQTILPPRYQEQMLTEVPFMRVFLPPTPMGGTLPTVAPHEGGISPADLLAAPISAPTLAPTNSAGAALIVPPTPVLATLTPTLAPTNQPTIEAATQQLSANDPPQQIVAASRPPTGRMYGFTWVRQHWNDCGPANITMALSHFGWRQDQDYAANILKPNPEDKNVSPSEMVAFVRDQTLVTAVTRMGGDEDLLKSLIAANIPVIVETGYSLEGEDWLGHYQTVVGYDDNQNVFYIYDSWLGTGDNTDGMTENYRDFDQHWQSFNRTFIAIYEKDRESVVQKILGDRADVNQDAQHALAVARQEARANRQNAFAWFNLGTSYLKLGQYDQAASAYDQAIQLHLPFRMLWYQFGPFEAYFETKRYDDVLALVNNNLASAGNNVEETFYWQGKVYQAQGKTADAIASYQKAMAQNPNYEAARQALAALGG